MKADINVCYQTGIRAFPTMKPEYDGKSTVLGGYMPYSQPRRVVASLCGDDLKLDNDPMKPEALASFASTYKKVAAEEIRVTFDLSDAQLRDAVPLLLDSGLYAKQKRGSSYFILDKASLVWDSVTGTCHVNC